MNRSGYKLPGGRGKGKSMPVLMPEMITEYVNSGGAECPFCRSGRLDATNQKIKPEGVIFFDCACKRCLREWKEQYTLTNISFIEQPKKLEAA